MNVFYPHPTPSPAHLSSSSRLLPVIPSDYPSYIWLCWLLELSLGSWDPDFKELRAKIPLLPSCPRTFLLISGQDMKNGPQQGGAGARLWQLGAGFVGYSNGPKGRECVIIG